jgi:DNA-binding MarR family transcriptional regulator
MITPVRKALDFVAARRSAGLSDETMLVLLVLFQQDELTKDQLAEAAEINPTTLPRYLSGLIRSGHVTKRQRAEDLRVVLFSLSAHGRKLVDSLLKHFPST